MVSLIKKAIASNFDLAIAIEKIQEMRSNYRMEFAKLLPQVNLLGDALAVNLGNDLLFGSPGLNTRLNTNFIGIETLWEVDLWGRIASSKDAAYHKWEAQIEDMRDVYIMLLADVARAYNDIRVLEKKIALARQSVADDKSLLVLNKDSSSAGLLSFVPPLDETSCLMHHNLNCLSYPYA